MLHVFAALSSLSRRRIVALVIAIVLVVAIGDAASGYELSFSLFYLSAVAIAVWFVGERFALGVAVGSALAALLGDFLAGAREKLFVASWNAALALGFYVVTIKILFALRELQESLERKVRERTSALANEMQAREQLEAEIMAVGEREQRRIGHDLHDTLCQHLTATAIAGEVLREKLVATGSPNAQDAGQVIALIEEGITMARETARGLAPIDFEPDGLMRALEELCPRVRSRFHLTCRFRCPFPVTIDESNTAVQLFRIAQEAVTNACKHASAAGITISLVREDEGPLRLSVEDDGVGFPPDPTESRGMGLRIMQHRAEMIGGEFHVQRLKTGTRVECVLRVEPRGASLKI